mgnify:FL=1
MKSNKASLLRRILAFLIDFALITIIVVAISSLLPKNNNIDVLNREFNDTVSNMENVSFSVSFNQMALIYKDLDQARIMYSVINAVMIFIYFIFIPYFFDGKTVGKKILKIKTVRNDKECLSLKNLVIKNMIDTGLMYMLFSLMLIYILPGYSYFIFVIALSILQISLIVASICMIIKRKDKRGLNDILSGTKVVNDFEETKLDSNNIENDTEVEK